MAKRLERIIGKRRGDLTYEVEPMTALENPNKARAKRLERLFRGAAVVYVRVRANWLENLSRQAKEGACFGGYTQLTNNGKIRHVPDEYRQYDKSAKIHFVGLSHIRSEKFEEDEVRVYEFLPGELGEPGPALAMTPAHACAVLRDMGPYCAILEEADPDDIGMGLAEAERAMLVAEKALKIAQARTAEREKARHDAKKLADGVDPAPRKGKTTKPKDPDGPQPPPMGS